MQEVGLGDVAELRLDAEQSYANPAWEQRVVVTWRGPEVRQREVDAFWDGGSSWRARFSPDAEGEWSYETRCLGQADAGLHRRRGRLRCRLNASPTDLSSHGVLRTSADGHYLEHADGTPFLWLADTAWNGVLKARPEDWERYLARRREQGFTAVQFVLTHWRAFPEDAGGERAYSADGGELRINPAFYQRLDAKVAAVNEAGLLAVPVLLWAIRASGDLNPGYSLSEDHAALVARYLVARYGAYQVAWILGGDADYRGESAARWRRIGQAVFGDRRDRLVTMHPQGQQWVGAEFGGESWFDFVGYQSGHGDSEEHLRWLTEGPPAREWNRSPARPVINLEPNYEGHVSYHSRRRFTDREVRRGLYWSLLVSPTVGVTYGHHSIWPWMEELGIPTDHPGSGEAPPWHESLNSAGATSVTHLRRLLDALPWWRLRPEPGLLAEQPGVSRAEAFVAAASTPEHDLAVAYLPLGGGLRLRGSALKNTRRARWYSPSDGSWHDGGALRGEGDPVVLACPGEGDWVLVLD